ncbi:signal peptidase I [Thiohalobacter thiocyanaticus]|uniref:Signal peptidase I n=1 Tax=Thiohalobacter thiocyanaticus TaxID=585455 RepID=A0A1Z4VPB9_9GAMM|nr:signal peptidase I [Thiohalobacter thiocyanaticus]BAZ93467.1 signal peptidase I [Thiohalobacter thiocyanaticus]
MSFNFPLILVLATFITGLIWLLDAWLWRPKRRQAAEAVAEPERREAVLKEPVLVEYSRAFFPVILVVLLLRSFLAEPFRIPSGSMMPTLLVGDFILVNKFAYGLRLPVVNTRFLDLGEPERGDVVVFRYPDNPSVDYIKRVVGLPGDRVAYRDKILYINGERMPQQVLGTYIAEGAGLASTGASERLERLNEVEHRILVRPGYPNIEGEWMIPEGHYFMMGDNRDNSKDSRYFGLVPEENLVGKAFIIWMSWDGVNNRVTWSRIGDSIH